MTNTQALKLARADVTPLHYVGGQYAYSVYSHARDAWMETPPSDYFAARAARSETIRNLADQYKRA